MNSIKLLLLLTLPLFASDILRYYCSIQYHFDTNIGQNIVAEKGSYLYPEMGVELYPFRKRNICFWLNTAYDSHVLKRDFDDNSPIVEGGVLLGFKRDKSYYSLNVLGEQYVGMHVYTSEDNYNSYKNWVPVLRTVGIDAEVKWRLGKVRPSMEIEAIYQDFAEEGEDSTVSDDALVLSFEPALCYKTKKSKSPISLTRLDGLLGYEFKHSENDEKKYHRWGISLINKLQFFRGELDIGLTYSRKHYLDFRKFSATGDMILPKVTYVNIESEICVPIIAGFEFWLGGELRFRDGTYPTHTYDRHTAYTGITWKSSVKRREG